MYHRIKILKLFGEGGIASKPIKYLKLIRIYSFGTNAYFKTVLFYT